VVARLREAGCVFAEDEADVLIAEAPTPAGLAGMLERRAGGLPLEQVVGWAAFCETRIALEAGVFVPRRRTEFLVQRARALLEGRRPTVVDLCCGSGAVGVALASARGGIDLHAVDIDADAVRCARTNVGSVGGRVYHGDLYEPLPASLLGRVDVLVANAPYVPADAVELLPREARVHEPRVALDGGPDGLDVQRRIVAEAASWITPGGHLLVETSATQSSGTASIVAAGGLSTAVYTSEELGATVVVGRRPPPTERARP
jgi:release factor glutamine methyltransferase